MDTKGNTRLTPPAIRNVSCSHPRYSGNIIDNIGPNDTIQALFVIVLTFLIIMANLTVIIVINSRRYAPYLHPQVNYSCFVSQCKNALYSFAFSLVIY